MSQTSQVTRIRPAVIAFTGVAAAAGIYYLYSSFSEQPGKTALRRSNAVHRTRGERPLRRKDVTCLRPDDEAPLGKLTISMNDLYEERNLAMDGIPTSIEGHQFDAELQHEVNVGAVECLLWGALLARTPLRQQLLIDMGLGELPEAMADHAVDVVRGLASKVMTFYSNDRFEPTTLTLEEIDGAITNFERSDTFWSPDLGFSSSHNNGSTFAETEDVDGLEGSSEPSQGLKGLLYHIAETDARRKAYEHRGIHCEECGERPIRGIRWHCLNCPDFDLCSTCEANSEHQKTHVFAKIKIPIPVLSQPAKEYPLWYPGDPRKLHAPLNASVKKRLQEQYSFDSPQMDANYDQFICMANVPWAGDPNGVKGAIDRRAFYKAMTSERWPQRFRPNAMYDRMFAFYDTNNDGVIGFEEFVSGLAYLRGHNRFTPLRRALRGFDINGDEHVDRADFLRLLRAKYEIQKLLINAMIEGHENEQTQVAMDTLRSSQPISSVFSLEEIPQGEQRTPAGKTMNVHGDMQPLPNTKTILDDNEGWTEEDSQRHVRFNGNGAPIRSREQSNDLSASEETAERQRGDASNGAQSSRPHYNHNEGQPSSSMDHDSRSVGGNDAQSFGHVNSEGDQTDERLDQYVLWQITEDGFNEMLDPLFKDREERDREIIDTRPERKRWRKEIDQFSKEDRLRQEELESGAKIDPLMATAMSSLNKASMSGRRQRGSRSRPDFVGRLVPTDPVSLERREAEIAQRPLGELLNDTGYSMVDAEPQAFNVIDVSEESDGNNAPENSSASSNHDLTSEQTIPTSPASQTIDKAPEDRGTVQSFTISANYTCDPTMPQNRPNTHRRDSLYSATSEMTKQSPKAVDERSVQANETEELEEPPPDERLRDLASLDKDERGLELRGGPGRLSFDEVEKTVKDDTTKELKGLVTSWLEWASF